MDIQGCWVVVWFWELQCAPGALLFPLAPSLDAGVWACPSCCATPSPTVRVTSTYWRRRVGVSPIWDMLPYTLDFGHPMYQEVIAWRFFCFYTLCLFSLCLFWYWPHESLMGESCSGFLPFHASLHFFLSGYKWYSITIYPQCSLMLPLAFEHSGLSCITLIISSGNIPPQFLVLAFPSKPLSITHPRVISRAELWVH